MASRFIEEGKDVLNKGVATLGLGGAHITDSVNNLLNYYAGIEKPQSAVKTMQPYFNRAWGINNNPTVSPSTVQNKNVPLPPPENKMLEAPIAKATPSGAALFDLNKSHAGDIYAALRDPKAINDKQFKKFVELHGEELPGIGFIEDAKTGKITRVASKPEPPPGMNVTQANAAANMLIAQAHAKTAEATAKGLGGDLKDVKTYWETASKVGTRSIQDPNTQEWKTVQDAQYGADILTKSGHPPPGLGMQKKTNTKYGTQDFLDAIRDPKGGIDSARKTWLRTKNDKNSSVIPDIVNTLQQNETPITFLDQKYFKFHPVFREALRKHWLEVIKPS